MSSIRVLQDYGQSIWLDYLRRCLITSGELQRLIDQDGIRGVTSNPAILQKAIAGSTDYDTALKAIEQDHDRSAISLYEQFAIEDIQATADILQPIYQQTHRQDGYVSLEVSPYLAHDTVETVIEARRLWQAVGRDNLMIKVPATPAGIPAIQRLINEGINVNVTLLFSQTAYEQVADAYMSGLEALAASGASLSPMASVASFFISRIDTAVENLVTARLASTADDDERSRLEGILGKVAIANAKLTYQRYRQIYGSDRWQALAAEGARPQRLLWASTGTKNPQYSNVLYVEELIGAETVNTVPPATLDAFRQMGVPRSSLLENLDAADATMLDLQVLNIPFQAITEQLLQEGLTLFTDAFDQLLGSVERKREAVLSDSLDRLTYSLPDSLAADVKLCLEDWRATGKIRRLWARDAALWTGADEANWLGWLNITDDQLAHIDHLKQFAQEIKDASFTDVLLLGMGGSSLCPEVLKLTFGTIAGFPTLHILDSTDPVQIKAIEQRLDLTRTLFIVSSKSGSTLEPNVFKQYFFERAQQALGQDAVGDRFVAITDPSSKLEQVAKADGFRRIFYGDPSIGGRYSALSNFGMVPAAAMGLEVARFLDLAEEMVHSCAAAVPAPENPGVVLGAILGVSAQQGRDKVTLIASPAIADLGAWLEQLLAESTGKDGRGIIPVDLEPLCAPEQYGNDRLFVYIRLESAPDASQDAAAAALQQAGQPIVCIRVTDPYHLGQEFFRWEMATAVAGAVIGINAFNQPDVEASKLATRELTTAYEATGELPSETPIYSEAGVSLYADRDCTVLLNVKCDYSLVNYLKVYLDQLSEGDYFALLAYIEMNERYHETLQAIRQTVQNAKKTATCLGFGPRFLHSTGQAYKGGANTGVFLQITYDGAIDIPVPGQQYSFNVVKAAQARGDFQVLVERNRRALRVHLGADVESGLNILHKVIQQALA